MMKRIPLDPRVWPGVILIGCLLGFEIIWHVPFATPLLVVTLIAHLLFFRDPRRQPSQAGLLAPADGTVTGIEEVFEDKFLHEQAIRIRIFLSVFDVHVTRAPESGIIQFQEYSKGKFLNALLKSAFEHNESNWIGIEYQGKKILVRQMAGAIARRIHSDVQVGKAVGRGEKIGMICYGSGVEFFIAARFFNPNVRIGQHIAAGLTVLGQWTEGGSKGS